MWYLNYLKGFIWLIRREPVLTENIKHVFMLHTYTIDNLSRGHPVVFKYNIKMK